MDNHTYMQAAFEAWYRALPPITNPTAVNFFVANEAEADKRKKKKDASPAPAPKSAAAAAAAPKPASSPTQAQIDAEQHAEQAALGGGPVYQGGFKYNNTGIFPCVACCNNGYQAVQVGR